MPYHCGHCGAANSEDRTACEKRGVSIETAEDSQEDRRCG